MLAKFGTMPLRKPREPFENSAVTDASSANELSPLGRLALWLFHLPDEVSRPNWAARIVALAVLSLWTLWIWRDTDIAAGEIGSNFLHLILLPFHEAGHYAIFRWFGQFIMILGGTPGQHLMPLVLGVVLLVKGRAPLGAALYFWLLGFSVIDMGVYMYEFRRLRSEARAAWRRHRRGTRQSRLAKYFWRPLPAEEITWHQPVLRLSRQGDDAARAGVGGVDCAAAKGADQRFTSGGDG